MNKLNKFTIFALASCLSLTLISCEQEDSKDNNNSVLLGLFTFAEGAKSCETPGSTLTLSTPIEICNPAGGAGVHFVIHNLSNAFSHSVIFSGGYKSKDYALNGPTAGNVLVNNFNAFQFWMYDGRSTSGSPASAIRYEPNYAASAAVRVNTGLTASELPIAVVTDAQCDAFPGAAANCKVNKNGGETKTFCLDVTQTTSGPSRITLWLDGKNGASCSDKTTLNAGNAVLNKLPTDFANNLSPLDTRNFYLAAAPAGTNSGSVSFSKITVSTETAIK
ncbi:hypothetical protein EHQ68_17560 [Leptospira congkakensis]|uniref:Lipoprotein n=1 Tax=Leptospira congkakensis TaxID=2484932 RepID=A0A4Z1AI21_9LEPT|nr:hypothetical protein [Leptospira congkakensis]TGL85251.1 hypothetical protein EHQ68_17560 [Leptospira congkakensis]TGL85358.1 hypothetical protein EHQ69_18525 [Leptospira congkakensis]TGL99898.1 hypothetical protein EHQ70_00880 [Leptospira congkakensis]